MQHVVVENVGARQRRALAGLTDVVDRHLFAGAGLNGYPFAALYDALTEIIIGDAYAYGISDQVVGMDGIAPGGFDGDAVAIAAGRVAPDLIVVGIGQQYAAFLVFIRRIQEDGVLFRFIEDDTIIIVLDRNIVFEDIAIGEYSYTRIF